MIRKLFGSSLVLLLVALASCGGGSGTTPAVSNITATNLRYTAASTARAVITVNGRNLLAGVQVSVEGPCDTVTRTAGGTDDTQQFTCAIKSSGPFKAYVVADSGATIGQLSTQIPTPQLNVVTSKGTFVVELDPVAAPATVQNYLTYVNASFFNSLLFHRVVKDRLVQTGGYTTGLVEKLATGSAVTLESNNGLKNLRGTIAMARTDDPNSARSQWYVNVADNPDLDFVNAEQPGYAVFGKVTSGMDVIDAISAVETHVVGVFDSAPVTEIVVTSVTQVR